MTARLRLSKDSAYGGWLPSWATPLEAFSERLGVARSWAGRVGVGGCAGWE